MLPVNEHDRHRLTWLRNGFARVRQKVEEVMRVRYLDSRDVETLSEAMARAARMSNTLDVVAAFLTKAGADQVLKLAASLAGPKRGRRVRVLVGTWLGVTDPAAIRRLRRSKALSVRIARTPGFHAKHLSLRSKGAFVSFTGSANFTAKGLGGEGELVVEVTDKASSPSASAEEDAFRRLWADAYPDALTDSVLAAYSHTRKPPHFEPQKGAKFGKTLLQKFGRRARAGVKPLDDGTTLWFPVYGTLSEGTAAALAQEVGVQASKSDAIGLGNKSTFNRIKNGARKVWVLDLRGRPTDRSLCLHDVLREVEMPTDRDGRYFAVLSLARRTIALGKKANRVNLKALGLVRRIDSLASDSATLRRGTDGKAVALLGMSSPQGRKPKTSK